MPSAYTPWPEGRPPHMIQVDSYVHEDATHNMIRNHLEKCEECRSWSEENGGDLNRWIWNG